MPRKHLSTTIVEGKSYPYAWCMNNAKVCLVFYIDKKRILLKDLENYSSPESEGEVPLWLGKYRRVDKRGFWVYSKRYASSVIKQYLNERKTARKHTLL